ncbi:hypothetical protein Tco_1178785, partial [Tanacetum coccineum]
MGDHRKVQLNELNKLQDQLFSGKLKSRWTGPFTVAQVFPYGTIELSQADGPNFKVNGHRVKHYFGGDIPIKCISKLNESLVVLEKNHDSNANVWIMHNGDPKSFTPIFTIDTLITFIRDVVGFRKNGAPLLLKKKAVIQNELIVYDPKSKQINHTGISEAFYYFFASPYTQTLLLLDHKDSVNSEM